MIDDTKLLDNCVFAVRAELDSDILKGLPDEDRENIEIAIACGALTLCDSATALKNFAFDETSVAVIEKRLVDKYVGRVLKWDGLKIKRIKLDSGLHSSSAKQIKRFEGMLNCYGLLFAYCVAKINGGKFELDKDHALVVRLENGVGVLPGGKAWKFLKNGKEDSLVGFLPLIENRHVLKPEIEHIRNEMLESLKARGVLVPEGHRWQDWHDDATGELTKIVLLDAPSEDGGKLTELRQDAAASRTRLDNAKAERTSLIERITSAGGGGGAIASVADLVEERTQLGNELKGVQRKLEKILGEKLPFHLMPATLLSDFRTQLQREIALEQWQTECRALQPKREQFATAFLGAESPTITPALSDEQIAVTFDRSAGENQIFATALIAGLAEVSKVPAPLVVDTPLGRLDSKHRENIFRFWTSDPSRQVILLSQDEEINSEFYRRIKKNVAVTYLLEHSDVGDGIGRTVARMGKYFAAAS